MTMNSLHPLSHQSLPKLLVYSLMRMGSLRGACNTHKTHKEKTLCDILQQQATNSRFSAKGFYAFSLRERTERRVG